MELTFNVKKKHLLVYSLVVVVLLGVFVFAAAPNPGHLISEIETTSCTGGQVLQNIGSAYTDGYVCVTDQTGTGGSGDIDGVTAGSGLTGGGTVNTVTLNVGAGSGISVAADAVSLMTCTSGQILESTGTGWACGTDDAGTGGDRRAGH